MSKLIYDDGELRNCDYNVARLSIWQYILELELKRGFFFSMLKDTIAESLIVLASGILALVVFVVVILMLLTFPISVPIILITKAHKARKRARGRIERMGESWND